MLTLVAVGASLAKRTTTFVTTLRLGRTNRARSTQVGQWTVARGSSVSTKLACPPHRTVTSVTEGISSESHHSPP